MSRSTPSSKGVLWLSFDPFSRDPSMRMFLLLALALGACTSNSSAKLYGGDMNVALKCDVKLFDITWKEDSFWYAVRPMREDEPAEVYTFQEKSSFGMMEGSVTIKECRSHTPTPPVG